MTLRNRAGLAALVTTGALALTTLAGAGAHAARPQPPAPPRVPDASLVLDDGRYRALPDVPGALATTHLRNNNREQSVGTYVDSVDSDGVATGLRGFLMSRSGKVTKTERCVTRL